MRLFSNQLSDQDKVEILEKSTSYPGEKIEHDVIHIKIPQFDKIIIDKFLEETIINETKSEKQLIFEIIDILNENKSKFYVNKVPCVGFYWRGMPIFKIFIDNKANVDEQEGEKKMLYISLPTYVDYTNTYIRNKYLFNGALSVIAGAGFFLIAKYFACKYQ